MRGTNILGLPTYLRGHQPAVALKYVLYCWVCPKRIDRQRRNSQMIPKHIPLSSPISISGYSLRICQVSLLKIATCTRRDWCNNLLLTRHMSHCHTLKIVDNIRHVFQREFTSVITNVWTKKVNIFHTKKPIEFLFLLSPAYDVHTWCMYHHHHWGAPGGDLVGDKRFVNCKGRGFVFVYFRDARGGAFSSGTAMKIPGLGKKARKSTHPNILQKCVNCYWNICILLSTGRGGAACFFAGRGEHPWCICVFVQTVLRCDQMAKRHFSTLFLMPSLDTTHIWVG